MCIIIITIHNINRRYLFISRYFKLMLSHLSGLSCKHCAFILWQLHIVLIQHTELLTEQCQLKSMGTQPMRQKYNKAFLRFQIHKELFGSLWTIMKLDKKMTLIKTNKNATLQSKKLIWVYSTTAAINSLQFAVSRCEWVVFAKQSRKGETREERWGNEVTLLPVASLFSRRCNRRWGFAWVWKYDCVAVFTSVTFYLPSPSSFGPSVKWKYEIDGRSNVSPGSSQQIICIS